MTKEEYEGFVKSQTKMLRARAAAIGISPYVVTEMAIRDLESDADPDKLLIRVIRGIQSGFRNEELTN